MFAAILTKLLAASLLVFSDGCYYNHELSVPSSEGDFNLKWRDSPSGPLPGIGFEIAFDNLVFELEGEDLPAVSVGDTKYEFSIPFVFNKVDLHEKSLCDWDYGCAHCQHVAGDVCSLRLYAMSTVTDRIGDINGNNIYDIPDELFDAFETMATGLKALCEEHVMNDETYATNDIVEACNLSCIST